jgi:hypothetical protein
MSSRFCLDSFTYLAAVGQSRRLEDQLHPTSFTSPILSIAVLAEVSPFVIPTLEYVLLVKAHPYCLSEERLVFVFWKEVRMDRKKS